VNALNHFKPGKQYFFSFKLGKEKSFLENKISNFSIKTPERNHENQKEEIFTNLPNKTRQNEKFLNFFQE